MNEIKSKASKQYGEEDWRQLENLMYDKFFVKLDDAQVRNFLHRQIFN